MIRIHLSKKDGLSIKIGLKPLSQVIYADLNSPNDVCNISFKEGIYCNKLRDEKMLLIIRHRTWIDALYNANTPN